MNYLPTDKTPTVSVIMPLYNAEPYVANAIHSVLAQSVPDLELIIINDASTDNGEQIVHSVFDPRVTYFSFKKNRGVSLARNFGIHLARGQFIAFIDADDEWHVDKLKHQIRHLHQQPEVGLSFCRSAFMNQSGQLNGQVQLPKLKHIQSSDVLLQNPIGNGSSPLIRRRALIDLWRATSRMTGGEGYYFDKRLRRAEDMECWLRLSELTHWKIEGIPDVLTYYRVVDTGLSSNMVKHYRDFLRVLVRIKTYSPIFIESWRSTAMAMQAKYLMRQSLRFNHSQLALSFFKRIVKHAPKVVQQYRWRIALVFTMGIVNGFIPSKLSKAASKTLSPYVRWVYQFRMSSESS